MSNCTKAENEAMKTIRRYHDIGAPAPPQSVLSHFIGDTVEAAVAPSRAAAMASQEDKKRRARRKLGGLTGAQALLAALRGKDE